jgi:hypothetical protein
MKKNISSYTFTLIGVTAAVLLFIVTVVFDLDIFDACVRFLLHLEEYNIDELIIPVLIVFVFCFVDLLRKYQSVKIQYEKCMIFHSTVTAMHHILNNFLNQMQLFKIEASENKAFDKEILELYDEVIHEASEQIQRLSEIKVPTEELIKEAVYPG